MTTKPTYYQNRYGQGRQDGEALTFGQKPTTTWLERQWLLLTCRNYAEGFENGQCDAQIALGKNPHVPQTPCIAWNDNQIKTESVRPWENIP